MPLPRLSPVWQETRNSETGGPRRVREPGGFLACHCRFRQADYNPSTTLAMMFFWTCLAPPNMDAAREFRYLGVTVSV